MSLPVCAQMDSFRNVLLTLCVVAGPMMLSRMLHSYSYADINVCWV